MAKTYKNVNLVNNESFIWVGKLEDAKNNLYVDSKFWKSMQKKKLALNYQKYQIKETDLQQKTATFTAADYLDLTTGLYVVQIASPYHENFAGVILSVEYDKETGLYNYQCQDWSRLHQGTFNLICSNINYYDILRWLITHGSIGDIAKITNKKAKKFKKQLSGLRPLSYYNMKLYGNPQKSNPFKNKKKIIIKDKTYIEAIKDIVYGVSNYIRVYFNQNGVIQIEPYSRKEWLKKGVYVTTKELASEKFTFDTSNVITGVQVSSSDATKVGKGYHSSELVNLDLSVFFGNLETSISSTAKTKTTTKTTTENNAVAKGTPVHMNMDRIGTASADKTLLNNIKKELEKQGYKVTIGARNPNAHYQEISKVKKNGIYFCIFGGLDSGMIRTFDDAHYTNVLKKKNAQMVFGHLYPKGSKWVLTDKLTWLPRAHDDNYSPGSFKGMKNPKKFLEKNGIGIADGTNYKEIVSKFPNFPNGNNNENNAKNKTQNTEVITDNDVKETTNDRLNALAEIGKPIRDFLKLQVKVPLGNKGLANVHTNMFLYTELPKEFTLTNFKTIANAIKSKYSRNEGYKLNRWYIESVDITNDGTNFSMNLTLNPFPSALLDYADKEAGIRKAYTDAFKKNANNTTAAKANEKKDSDNYCDYGTRSDGKTDCSNTFDITTRVIGNGTNIKNLQNKTENKLAMQRIGKTGTNYHKYVKDCKTAKQVYKKLTAKIPLKNAGYSDNHYNCASDAFNHLTNLNCAEKARLFKACCDSLYIPCVIYHVENHYMNGVLINGKWETADICYRSGITHKDYNTAHFNK